MTDLETISKVRQAMLPLIEKMATDRQTSDALVIDALNKIEAGLRPHIEIKPEAPIVNIDTHSVIKAIEDLHKTMEALQKRQPIDINGFENLIDELKKANQPAEADTAIDDYRPHDQADSTGANYYGFLAKTGEWYIMREQDNLQRYAAGSGDYEKAWDSKEKQTYDYLNKVL